MIPILLASSRASWLLFRVTNAFFSPLGVIRVFTFFTARLYSSLHDFLIIGLVALLCTMNTRVLLSSMFLTADSLFMGCLITANLSNVTCFFTALKMFLGFLFWVLQTGLLKVVLDHTLTFFWV